MFMLKAPAFEDGQEMPQKYGKKIENISPPLIWESVPQGTKSFALSMVDYMSAGRYYVHWLVCDMSTNVRSLQEDAAGKAMPPDARELKPYAGPFPPSGTHEYEFRLYALKTDKLRLPEKVSLDEFNEAVKPDTLGTAQLIGKFTKVRSRSK